MLVVSYTLLYVIVPVVAVAALCGFRDRFRTAINVLGDAVGATVVEKLSLDDLRSMQKQDNKDTDSKDTVITAM